MYSKPTVVRFGSFRDLTQYGFEGAADGISVLGIGCNVSVDGYSTCPTTS